MLDIISCWKNNNLIDFHVGDDLALTSETQLLEGLKGLLSSIASSKASQNFGYEKVRYRIETVFKVRTVTRRHSCRVCVCLCVIPRYWKCQDCMA